MIPDYLQDLFKAQSYDPNQFFLIAGPCVVEDEALVMEIGDKVSTICKKLGIPYVFKASYRKANRTSANSFTGIGDDTGMELIKKVGATYNVPTTSDIHAHEEAAIAAQYIDILQIPAFLCRQTDLLVAAAQTGKIVNVKKGQFLSVYPGSSAARAAPATTAPTTIPVSVLASVTASAAALDAAPIIKQEEGARRIFITTDPNILVSMIAVEGFRRPNHERIT